MSERIKYSSAVDNSIPNRNRRFAKSFYVSVLGLEDSGVGLAIRKGQREETKMANEVRIKLTADQKAKIKSATGKDMSEIRVGSVGNNPAVSGKNPASPEASARFAARMATTRAASRTAAPRAAAKTAAPRAAARTAAPRAAAKTAAPRAASRTAAPRSASRTASTRASMRSSQE
jgi:hypothetical protein